MSLPKNLMTLADLSPAQIKRIVGVAKRLKWASKRVLPPTGPVLREAAWREQLSKPTKLSAPPQSLRNLSIALLFSKRSTRTRVSAETAAQLLGGQAIFLGRDDIQLGVNESARDTARVLSGMCQGIFARVGDHSEIEELAKYAEVPVINALSSLWHPTQVLADLMTLLEEHSLQTERLPALNPHTIPYSSPSPPPEDTSQEPPENSQNLEQQPAEASAPEKVPNAVAAEHRVTQARRELRPLTIAYVGDSANVLHDMLVTYPRLGHKLQIASPPDPRYRAPTAVWDKVVELECDKNIEWTADPREAVKGADVVVTDTWISMGQEAEYEQRVKDFQGYQVTEEMCEGAKRGWKFLHCLPRKSHEVNDEVFYGPRSLVFPEADNRKWTIMALFHVMFGGGSHSALPHGRPQGVYQPSLNASKSARQAGNNRHAPKPGSNRFQNGRQTGGNQNAAERSGAAGETLLAAVEKEVEATRQFQENLTRAKQAQKVRYKPSTELGSTEGKETA